MVHPTFLNFLQFFRRNIVLIFIFISVFGVWLFLKYSKEIEEKKIIPKQQDIEYDYSDATKTTDTLEIFGLCAVENIVIRQDAEVRRTPNVAKYNTLYQLKFGTIVYTKNADIENTNNIKANDSLLEKETKNGFVAVYSVKPITLSDLPVGYMAIEDLIEKSEFKNYKPKFEATPLLIPDDIKSVIESHFTIDGIAYKFIEDEDRYNNSLCYGDFNDDGTTDFAVILDKADNSESIILLYGLLANKNTYSLMYKKVHPTLLKIKTIPKNTKINVNFEITSFPFDGIHITNSELATFFQIYDAHDKSFIIFKN